MPRAKKKIGEVQVVGPTLLVGGSELVSFKTDFKSEGLNGLNQTELSALSLRLHNEFLETVTKSLAEASVVVAKKSPKPAAAIKD